MRPVHLYMNGFASFREPAYVDFNGADYFALVGSTGSGKSTVIDAMTFALYGTAFRWKDLSAVADALAPTANRCTVALEFDIGAERYLVSREIRRTGNQVSTKAVSLVRYHDPNARHDYETGEGAENDVVAGSIAEIKTEIPNLLGLSFSEFCQCVVLPQGEFAAFLKAIPGDRQKILLKLLGASFYEGIGSAAGARATRAATTISVLTDQLGTYADADEDAETNARARVAGLVALKATVEELLPQIATATTIRDTAAATVARLEAEHAQLAGLTSPAGIVEIADALTTAEITFAAARKAEDTSVEAAQGAADAAKAGPQRHPLEKAQSAYTERAAATGRLETTTTTVQETTDAVEAAEQAADEAATAVQAAGQARDLAREAAEETQRLVRDLETRRTMLTAVTAPDGIDDLAALLTTSAAHQTAAAAAVQAADKALAEARDRTSTLPHAQNLTQAEADLDSYVAALADLDRQQKDRDQAVADAEQAASVVSDTAAALEEAVRHRDALRDTNLAATLRPHLVLGEACPVCEQTVATLPAELDSPETAAAEQAVVDAQGVATDAGTRHTQAMAQKTGLDTDILLTRTHLASLDTNLARLLPEQPSGSDRDPAANHARIAEARASLADAKAQLDKATAAADTAREDAVAAAEEAHNANRAAEAARTRLHTLLGTLDPLDPPTPDLDHVGLAAGWAQLVDWAVATTDSLDRGDLTVARSAAADAAEALTAGQAHLTTAEEASQAAGTRRTRTASAAAAAKADLDNLTDRIQVLDTVLTGAPDQTTLGTLLAEFDRLQAAVQETAQQAAQNRQARVLAETARNQQVQAAQAARRELRTTRDQLAALGAPSIDDTDLVAGWTQLTTWTVEQAQARETSRAAAAHEAATAAEVLLQLTGDLAGDLIDYDIEPTLYGATTSRADAVNASLAAQAVAVTLASADGHVDTIVKARAAAGDLVAKIAAETETQQVASELRNMLRSNNFPQWLANAALNTLVVGASDRLRSLSGDQFELTHKSGEFYVIDHADADSTRSVKTLSGGETFQASLALALALAEQLAALAAGGTAALDSIFLDEGFGTLDPDSLEIVAGTLENLAQEDRMVGVVTHVASLADSAPVRFRVTRDAYTSKIEPE